MKNRSMKKSLGLGSLLLLGITAVVVMRACARNATAAKKAAAKADKARWENEGGSSATPAT
jgi:hypothetical protein